MNRRHFIRNSVIGVSSVCFPAPANFAFNNSHISGKEKIMTVRGIISPDNMGVTLTHEHILVDFTGADKYNPLYWDRKDVEKSLIPFLEEIKKLGCSTFIDCTPEYIGRDPVLLQELSEKSGLNIITNTGFYGAQKNKFLPSRVYALSEEKLAEIWINEFENGISNTGIKPGFIKTGVDDDKLSIVHKKLVKAAAITHLQTGLTIVSHTGGYLPAFQQIDLLKELKVDPSAFVWVHAQNEENEMKRFDAAKIGAWISLDGISEDNVNQYVSWISNFKKTGFLHKLLISHDAGWYRPGEQNGGLIRGYATIFTKLIPALKNKNFTDKDINTILVKNPAEAFIIKTRKYKEK
jgi:phosphotriesterase-related protein